MVRSSLFKRPEVRHSAHDAVWSPQDPLGLTRFQEALRHLLHSDIGVTLQPAYTTMVKTQAAMLDGPVRALTNIAELDYVASPLVRGVMAAALVSISVLLSRDSKAHRVPCALWRQAGAICCVSEIAELLERFSLRNLAFMARRRAMTTPPASERQAGRMRPGAILQLFHRHEKRTRHLARPREGLFQGTGYCT